MPSRTSVAQAGRRQVEERIRELARAQHGVVTRAQLLGLGLHPGGILRRVRSGRLDRLHRGVYGLGPFLPPRASMMAAVLACGPTAVLSHRSAGMLLGLLEAVPCATPIDVTVQRPFDRSRSGLRVHRVCRLAVDERSVREGIPVTTPVRTLVDLASELDDHELERAIALAEREGCVSTEQLASIPAQYRGRASLPRLRAIVDRIGGPSFTRSEAEVRFLTLVRRARLPAPRVNAHIGGYEVDFLWPEHNLAVEVDGYRYHASHTRFESDRRRAAHLAALGLHVVSVTWRQVVDDELATAVQLAQVLARAERRRPRRGKKAR